MAKKERGNAYWTSVVCVDRCAFGEIEGRLYHPHWPAAHAFHGTMGFLFEMETLLNETQLPEPFMAMRKFRPRDPGAPPPEGDPFDGGEFRGKEATFSLQVLFRQNATWQGRVEWLEEKQEERFRSALELLLLMDSALLGKVQRDRAENEPPLIPFDP